MAKVPGESLKRSFPLGGEHPRSFRLDAQTIELIESMAAALGKSTGKKVKYVNVVREMLRVIARKNDVPFDDDTKPEDLLDAVRVHLGASNDVTVVRQAARLMARGLGILE